MYRLLAVLVIAAIAVEGISANGRFDKREVHKKSLHNALVAKIQQQMKLKTIKLGSQVDGNAYVDDVLASVDAQIKADHDDPYVVESIEVLGVQTMGTIGGFSTLHRVGDANVTQTDTELDIDVQIGVVNLEGLFNWTITWLLGYSGSADALVDTVTTSMGLHGDILPGATDVVLQLDEFDVPVIGRISVEVTGLGPLDPLVDDVINAIVNLVSGLIPTFFDGIIKVILQSVIDNYPCPLPA